MISAEITSRNITVVHPALLLAEPKLGAHALALLWSGDQVTSSGHIEGFLRIRRDSGAEAYVPAALCEPLAVAASHGAQPMTQVTQPAWLHRRVPPGDYNASPWIVRREETLVLLGHAQRFLHIRRPDGQIGYVPELLCEPVIRLADGSQATRVRQPIALYNYPAPGGQFSPDRIAATREQLLVLGEDSGFLLVQREDGALGYVPAVLCGPAMPDALLRAGPLDLGWIALGLLWALLNLGALLLGLRAVALVSAELLPYIGIASTLALVAALWFVSPRRYAARSLAIGVLLAYAMLYIDSGGELTFWI
ncbi:MAG: hypothetical protein ACJ8CR_12810 [Roseiflexaceae bacterium]